jgi:rubrerythrin
MSIDSMADNPHTPQFLEPFQIALKLEHEGRELFLDAARTTKSNLARQTFEFLAREEDKHIEKIEKFYKELELSDGLEYPDTEDSEAEEKLESFNKRLESIKDEYQVTSSDIEAYKMALEFESGTEEFYEEKFNESDDPKIKRFYKWLIDEEEMHTRLLKSCLRFVEDPVEWFKKRSKT